MKTTVILFFFILSSFATIGQNKLKYSHLSVNNKEQFTISNAQPLSSLFVYSKVYGGDFIGKVISDRTGFCKIENASFVGKLVTNPKSEGGNNFTDIIKPIQLKLFHESIEQDQQRISQHLSVQNFDSSVHFIQWQYSLDGVNYSPISDSYKVKPNELRNLQFDKNDFNRDFYICYYVKDNEGSIIYNSSPQFIKITEFRVYPTICNDIVKVEILITQHNSQFELLNSYGVIIKEYDFSERFGSIDLSTFTNGLYYIRSVSTNNLVKFIKID